MTGGGDGCAREVGPLPAVARVECLIPTATRACAVTTLGDRLYVTLHRSADAINIYDRRRYFELVDRLTVPELGDWPMGIATSASWQRPERLFVTSYDTNQLHCVMLNLPTGFGSSSTTSKPLVMRRPVPVGPVGVAVVDETSIVVSCVDDRSLLICSALDGRTLHQVSGTSRRCFTDTQVG